MCRSSGTCHCGFLVSRWSASKQNLSVFLVRPLLHLGDSELFYESFYESFWNNKKILQLNPNQLTMCTSDQIKTPKKKTTEQTNITNHQFLEIAPPPPFLWGGSSNHKLPGQTRFGPIQVPRRSSQPQEAVLRIFFKRPQPRWFFVKSPREKVLIQA